MSDRFLPADASARSSRSAGDPGQHHRRCRSTAAPTDARRRTSTPRRWRRPAGSAASLRWRWPADAASAVAMSSHPTTCETRASASEPQMRLPAHRQRELRVEARAQQRTSRHAQCGIEQRSRWRDQRRGSTHETRSGRWRSRGPRRHPARRRPPASSRRRRFCARPDVRATPTRTTPIMSHRAGTRPLAMPQPGANSATNTI